MEPCAVFNDNTAKSAQFPMCQSAIGTLAEAGLSHVPTIDTGEYAFPIVPSRLIPGGRGRFLSSRR